MMDEMKEGPGMVLDICNNIQSRINAIRQVLEFAYVNPNFPLEERWYLFANVPECFRERHDSLFRSEQLVKVVLTHGGWERYRFINLVDIVDLAVDEADRNALKEEILKNGCHYVKYEW